VEYLVTMTTHVPTGAGDDAIAEMRTREAAHSKELGDRGALLRLWRPPEEPGAWRTLGLFAADGDEELEQVLASMPLRAWRADEVTPLTPHPNDPAPDGRGASGSLPEFFTFFDIRIPADTPTETVKDVMRREAARVAELADDGSLARLWLLPARPGQTRGLALWRAADELQLHAMVASLPISGWITVETIPLSEHPSDPAMSRREDAEPT
jgi:muconolactone delta-isomerase